MVIFAEIAANLDRGGELVGAGNFACSRVLAPSFLNGQSDRWDTKRVRERRVVVHFELEDWVACLIILRVQARLVSSDHVFNTRRLFANSRRRDHDIDIIAFELRAPLLNKHAANLLGLAHTLIILLKFAGEQEVAQHASALHIEAEVFRAHAHDIVHDFLIILEVRLRAITKTIETSQVSGSLSRDEGKVEGQAVLHERYRDALNDSSLVLKHLDSQILDAPVTFIKFINVELIKDTNAEALKNAWSFKCGVCNAFFITNLCELREIYAS